MTATPDLGFVHRFEPAPGGAAAPTLLLLHGTGGDERDLLPLGRTLAPGCALLSPRGRVLEGAMPRFFRRLAEGVFDHDDLVLRTHELADFGPVQEIPLGWRLQTVAIRHRRDRCYHQWQRRSPAPSRSVFARPPSQH